MCCFAAPLLPATRSAGLGTPQPPPPTHPFGAPAGVPRLGWRLIFFRWRGHWPESSRPWSWPKVARSDSAAPQPSPSLCGSQGSASPATRRPSSRRALAPASRPALGTEEDQRHSQVEQKLSWGVRLGPMLFFFGPLFGRRDGDAFLVLPSAKVGLKVVHTNGMPHSDVRYQNPSGGRKIFVKTSFILARWGVGVVWTDPRFLLLNHWGRGLHKFPPGPMVMVGHNPGSEESPPSPKTQGPGPPDLLKVL